METAKKTAEKYFFISFRKNKYRQTGQKTNNPNTWIAVLKMKNNGLVYSSIKENSCEEEAINWDGINNPKMDHIRKIDTRKMISDLEASYLILIIFENCFLKTTNIQGAREEVKQTITSFCAFEL